MTKQNITNITLSLITSFFLFFSVSSYAAPASSSSATVSIEKEESVKHVVKKMTKALAKKGYKLESGDVKHINKVARRGIAIITRSNTARPRISCDYIIFNCRMENL